ncbi:MAG: class I SAM-dependent methyltransferase [Deltaproteobacteria bacterium]|nr:class I SAM-dependent methyltransferase [Deltaproteobacteria bacterium]
MKPRPSDLDHLKWIHKVGIHSFKGLKVLDLGCGSGFLCHQAIQQGAERAIGVDIVKPDVSDEDCHWQFRQANLDSESWAKDLRDDHNLILAFDIIEHLNAPFLFLTHCHRLLSDAGTLILTTPNTLSWERFLKPQTWSGVSDPQHKVLFTRYSLSYLLKQSGFQVEHYAAPLRSLKNLSAFSPQWGGQMLFTAVKD